MAFKREREDLVFRTDPMSFIAKSQQYAYWLLNVKRAELIRNQDRRK